jgi:hypothetical protein
MGAHFRVRFERFQWLAAPFPSRRNCQAVKHGDLLAREAGEDGAAKPGQARGTGNRQARRRSPTSLSRRSLTLTWRHSPSGRTGIPSGRPMGAYPLPLRGRGDSRWLGRNSQPPLRRPEGLAGCVFLRATQSLQ